MNRRTVLKALPAVFGAGVTVQPITVREAADIVAIVLTPRRPLSLETARTLREQWDAYAQDGPLKGVQLIVLPHDMDVEFVRRQKGTPG